MFYKTFSFTYKPNFVSFLMPLKFIHHLAEKKRPAIAPGVSLRDGPSPLGKGLFLRDTIILRQLSRYRTPCEFLYTC